MWRGMTRTLAGAAGLWLAQGCATETGPCDDSLAYEVVYDGAGLPAYAGQALVHASCGQGGFCHSSGIPLDNRFGAPAGLDFDVAIACVGDGPCEQETGRLQGAQRTVHEWGDAILRELAAGTMPPGDAGRQARAGAPEYGRADGSTLPSIESAEGVEIVRAWLACGAPVIERTTPHPSGQTTVGDVFARRAPEPVGLEPRWPSIYEHVIATSCVSCHGPEIPSQLEASALDMRDADVAYESLVGVPAAGSACSGETLLRVEPNDPDASLLFRKVAPTADLCGSPMPIGGMLDAEQVEAIRQWIAMGAARE